MSGTGTPPSARVGLHFQIPRGVGTAGRDDFAIHRGRTRARRRCVCRRATRFRLRRRGRPVAADPHGPARRGGGGPSRRVLPLPCHPARGIPRCGRDDRRDPAGTPSRRCLLTAREPVGARDLGMQAGGDPRGVVRRSPAYFPFITKTVMEYGGNVRVKVVLRPSTGVVTGTILDGSVIEFVSVGLPAAMAMVCPLGSTEAIPLSSTRMGCGVAARFTIFR